MSKDEHEHPEPWCFPDVTCEHGYYPYCPTCEHGLVIQEEWMQEDQCQWVCLLDNKE